MKKAMKAAVVAAGIAMLFGSVNMTEAAQSKAANKSTQAAAKTSAADKKAFEAAKAELSKKLAPGDLYILYVRDKALNGGEEFMNYMNMFQFKTYEDYLNQAAKLTGPTLTKPEGLPDGYKFVKGNIQPPLIKYRTQYQKEVKAEAAAKGKGVYYKKFDWKEVGEINLEFANGKDNLQMQISYSLTKDKSNGGYSYRTADEFDAETAKKHPEWVRNMLSWSDGDHVYNITTNPGNPLSKEELIKLAETAVKN
ncbi:DUF4367 domain-containing protein [Paenibacillus azoreducens]|uniref:DUF4367 domain-containing protein n=1 Tax=Paenibacillus azoreducens TaxID=116718 RepID=A0A919YC66_9BACL|nr:DUF4367 domain-containing protein [Paenibacillus azoreducens]GIO48527.1 hypothetical protein J34TS1_32920 [Paenibacillus azoreducens]